MRLLALRNARRYYGESACGGFNRDGGQGRAESLSMEYGHCEALLLQRLRNLRLSQ